MTHCVLTILMSVLLQPPAPPATPAKPQAVPEPKPKSALGVELTVEKSVANHPDVRVAEARLMEAQAALAQARLKVAIEMTTNQAKLDQAKANVTTQTEFFQKAELLKKSGALPQDEYLKATAAFTAAQADLVVQERLSSVFTLANQWPERAYFARLHTDSRGSFMMDVGDYWFEVGIAKPQSQSLLDLLQRKVKFAVKATDADQSVIGVLERSIKEWDFASANVIVRHPQAVIPPGETNGARSGIRMQPVEGENAIGVWMMMMLDDYNAQVEQSGGTARTKYQIYVREYGLLFAPTANAPDGAPTLAEFLRQPKK